MGSKRFIEEVRRGACWHAGTRDREFSKLTWGYHRVAVVAAVTTVGRGVLGKFGAVRKAGAMTRASCCLFLVCACHASMCGG